MAQTFRKLMILLLGVSVLLIGILMILLPGPAFLVIPGGLAILATEFVWAKNVLRRIKEKTSQTLRSFKKH